MYTAASFSCKLFAQTHVQDYAWCIQCQGCTCYHSSAGNLNSDHRKKVPECNVWWGPDKRTAAAEKNLQGLWVQAYCYSNHLEPTTVCEHAVGNLKSTEGQRWRRMQFSAGLKKEPNATSECHGVFGYRPRLYGICQMSKVKIQHPSYATRETPSPSHRCRFAPDFFHSAHLRNEAEPGSQRKPQKPTPYLLLVDSQYVTFILQETKLLKMRVD